LTIITTKNHHCHSHPQPGITITCSLNKLYTQTISHHQTQQQIITIYNKILIYWLICYEGRTNTYLVGSYTITSHRSNITTNTIIVTCHQLSIKQIKRVNLNIYSISLLIGIGIRITKRMSCKTIATISVSITTTVTMSSS